MTATQYAAEAMTAQEARDLAAAYAEKGIPVFPIGLSWNDEKQSVDKVPRTRNGFKDASSDPETVERLFMRSKLGPRQQWGVGVCPGPAGFIVLDVDVKGGATGLEDLARLEKELGELPPAMKVTTASGGFHLFFKRPTEEPIGNLSLAPGVEIRCDSGFVVAPGVTSPWGNWERDPDSPRLSETPQLPEAWAKKLNQRREDGSREPIADKLTVGSRHAALLRVAGAMRRQGSNYDAIHAALTTMNATQCDPPKPQSEIDNLAADIASRYNPNLDQRIQTPDPLPEITDTNERLELRWASDVKMKRTRWVLDGWWPLGGLSILAGFGGLGKSTYIAYLAAQLTQGTAPGDFYDTPTSVLILTAEDVWASTVVPRLRAAGADLERVAFLAINTNQPDEEPVPGTVSLPADLPKIEETLDQGGFSLICLDPLVSFLDGDTDSHKDASVRLVLDPLNLLAARYGIGVLGNMHFNKSDTKDPYRKLSSSAAFWNAPRAVAFLGQEHGSSRADPYRYLAAAKNNLAPRAQSIKYRIDETEVHGGSDEESAVTSKFQYIAQSEIEVHQLFSGHQDASTETNWPRTSFDCSKKTRAS